MDPVSKRRFFRWGGLLGLSAALTVGLVWWLGRPPVVEVVRIDSGPLQQTVVATGRVNAQARIDLGSEVTAVVQSVAVQEGDAVQEGQLLLQLRSSEAEAALAQAQAALAEAQARVNQLQRVGQPLAQSGVEQAQANLRNAEQELERARQLVAQGFFPQQRLDEAERAWRNAQSLYVAATTQLQANQAGGAEFALAQTRVVQAQAALDAAQARLDRLSVRSPVQGWVLERAIEPGSLAQPGRTLLTLAAQGVTRLEVPVDERRLQALALGQTAWARTDAFPGQTFQAHLSYIGPVIDPQRGTVEVRLEVPNPPEFLRPDMTVTVEILVESRERAVRLPAELVRDLDGREPWVLRVQGDTVQRVPVQIGLRAIGVVEALDGVSAGDALVPRSVTAVVPGMRVRAVEAEPLSQP